MRISDWSSDVCSSDLHIIPAFAGMPNKTRSTIYDLVAALAKIAILPDLGQMPPAAPAFVAGRAPDGQLLALIRRLLYPRCRPDEQRSEIDNDQPVAGTRDRQSKPRNSHTQ